MGIRRSKGKRERVPELQPVETVRIRDFRDHPELAGRKAIKCLSCGQQATHQRIILHDGEPHLGTNRCAEHKGDEFA